MSGARDEILNTIRRSLRRGALDDKTRQALDERLASHPVHIQPTQPGPLVERFAAKLQAVSGTFAYAASMEQAVQAIVNYLAESSLPLRLVAAPDPFLMSLPWPADLAVEYRATRGQDQVGLTGAFAAVAETGSLVLLSDPASPTTLNFLPDVHVALLRRERVVPHIEDVWALLRTERGAPPRAVNFITGPSRTADIEQTIQLGAHGPRRVHVVLLDG